jgi:pyruvate formate lyase activating enzyme
MSNSRETASGAQRSPSVATEELLATVVDIQRFSIHDGDGIRTSIYLKGCPLSCLWCQNPETMSPRIEPVFFRKSCISCVLCSQAAATSGQAWRREDGTVEVDTSVTGDWAILIDVCPTRALRWNAKNYPISELVDIVLRDRPFFRDGGGVTLSGGEPLFRPRVAVELLRRFREEGVNTAVETALHVPMRALAGAAEYSDTVFADFKVFDPSAHSRVVGRGNSLITANIEYLLTSPHRDNVVVRTPLIPGYTTGRDNIRRIGAFISGLYPEVRWELLNYNPLAAAKYDQVPDRDFAYAAGQNPPLYTPAEMDGFHGVARESGVRNVIEQ